MVGAGLDDAGVAVSSKSRGLFRVKEESVADWRHGGVGDSKQDKTGDRASVGMTIFLSDGMFEIGVGWDPGPFCYLLYLFLMIASNRRVRSTKNRQLGLGWSRAACSYAGSDLVSSGLSLFVSPHSPAMFIQHYGRSQCKGRELL